MQDHPLGLVAGGGQFPLLCARAARRQGRSIVAVAHKGETDPLLSEEVDQIEWVYLGQLGRLIETLKKAGASEAIFAGSITKTRIFKDVRPDLRAINLWRRLGNRLDDGILRSIAAELEQEGIQVLPSTILLKRLLVPSGVLTRCKPSEGQWEDIRFGWELAREIGRLDIGQCLVVKDRAVLAIEAIEGTDQTIRRGGQLGGPGAVVIKVCKPGQDTRFDLPSVGVETIEQMVQVKASVLAVEAVRTLFFDRDSTIDLANRSSIAVVGIDRDHAA
ncbi:MAG: UDP-2,3-diacylglucosamine diphosphatase LpxI [Deltaproteobacteria bacterium]|nr:UDP-2,3-diacylglucosamine diphosphatase LpxI [Deltaproteobacteria bacterium]MDL1960886.1 UDP-2,3-diacylglucosamine diphosphatase LpxI [Deltaproteobacteria bacterium]